ncbi:hypothetical protein OMP43_18150 [Sphingomonas sp. CBMAI 2297]|uniref:hypothetical protein n=1 Tax=Sphingomonas sp. CBMAI 2297 TaxID=2991720 RepID=UPI002457B705|nr:hypothetical protein [Sphingomonas sp. CBMAI 2297]MDH4745953.1 hypothetical protein [Sphingomonas sp. CBMAI 2297]
MPIGASVGKNGVNDLADVLVVQHLLNAWLGATGQKLLPTSGECGTLTIAAITGYQARVLAAARPDGLIAPGGRTWIALAAGQGAGPPLSGADWWNANQARYPNSAAVADLAQPFRDNVGAFLKALKDAGASVTISATRRNPIRAQLMHYSWRVAKGLVAPNRVPALPGLDIRWDHGDPARSKAGAQAMSDLFQIAFEPSLTSRHIEGRAIDMTIGWNGTIKVKDKQGKPREIGAPRSGDANTDLHRVGATYGVIKLVSDPPHWSDDGR